MAEYECKHHFGSGRNTSLDEGLYLDELKENNAVFASMHRIIQNEILYTSQEKKHYPARKVLVQPSLMSANIANGGLTHHKPSRRAFWFTISKAGKWRKKNKYTRLG